MNKQEIYAKVMSYIIADTVQMVEEQITKWLEENPYHEFDDLELDGKKTFRCPPTTRDDAREAVCEDMLISADECHCRDIAEFLLHEAVSYPLSKTNKFYSIVKDYEQQTPKLPITLASAKDFFDSLTEIKQ